MKLKLRHMSKIGFTYIEILIGIAIILFILVGMSGIFGVGIRSNKKAANTYIALGYAQELMEKTIAKDFNAIPDVVATVVEVTPDGFTKSLQVTSYKNKVDEKLVSVIVFGPDIKDIRLSCVVSDPAIIGGPIIL